MAQPHNSHYPPIGIAGHIGAGKDTIARILVARYGYVKYDFSDVLKRHLYWALQPDVRGYLDGFLERLERDKHLPPEHPDGWVRGLLQSWGQAHRRLGGPTYWTRWLTVSPRQVIPSVRHPEEVSFLREHGAQLWRVTRPGTGPDGHPSESHIPHLQVDAEIPNDGSLDDLAAHVERLMDGLDRSTRPAPAPDDGEASG